MAEIAVLRTHIVNYARTRPIYDACRKAGYSKNFLGVHREEITLHFLKRRKKHTQTTVRHEMQELMKAQKNVEMFFAEEKSTTEKAQAR